MKKLFILILCCISIATFANDSNYANALGEKNKKEFEMQQLSTKLTEINLVGIKVRTSFKNETNPETSQITPCVMQYFHQQLFEKIPNRKKPNVTYCVYTEYEGDWTEPYTYFIGEEVSSLKDVPSDLETMTISAQKYVKFTTDPGPMPNVCINAWQEIWKMSPKNLGGARRYLSDFEIYDERASDHTNTVLDLFIGIE
ncbi:MAG: hypothetical protein K940chlam5_00163 [Candidatus Anoxychlamydiales bacterium]|nr:hypothetical protein [Candidatus Anoxychlamydiales bacterium]